VATISSLNKLDVVTISVGDDKVVDVDPDHQLRVVVPPNADGVF
jgi:hypothetical protein